MKFFFLFALTLFSVHAQTLELNRYIINHRFGLHAIAIQVEMEDAPQELMDEVTHFLSHYPNSEDYWEILNKNLVAFLSNRYGKPVQVTLAIEANPSKPYNRKSICNPSRQAFVFDIANLELKENLVAMKVEFEYFPTASEYLNFFTVRDEIESFIKAKSADHTLPGELAKHLLTSFPKVQSFTITLEIPPHARNPAKYSWKATAMHE